MTIEYYYTLLNIPLILYVQLARQVHSNINEDGHHAVLSGATCLLQAAPSTWVPPILSTILLLLLAEYPVCDLKIIHPKERWMF